MMKAAKEGAITKRLRGSRDEHGYSRLYFDLEPIESFDTKDDKR
jgi:hypothetical protein